MASVEAEMERFRISLEVPGGDRLLLLLPGRGKNRNIGGWVVV